VEALDREILSRDFYECWQEPCSDIEPFLRVKGSAPHTWLAGHGPYGHVSDKSVLAAFYIDDHVIMIFNAFWEHYYQNVLSPHRAFEWSVARYTQDRAFDYARDRLLLSAPDEPDKSRPPVAKFMVEQQWVETHRNEFAGKWVALEGERLLASGDSAKTVFRLALDTGAQRPLVLKVEPSNQPPFAGW
jgi:hypothetical protein